MSIDLQIEELAGYVMGKTEAEVEDMVDNATVDDEIVEKYGIDFGTYCEIVRDLLPHTPVVITTISGKAYSAFVTKDKTRLIVRIPYKETT